MKKTRVLLAVLLTVLMLSSVLFISEAEPVQEGPWQADLLKLMDPQDVPSTTEISYNNTYEEGVDPAQHDIACEITVDGVSYGCEFVFEITGEDVSDWTAMQDWLGHIVTKAASTAGSDSEALAKAIDKEFTAARRQAQPDAEGNLPLYASPALKVKTIRVSTPFYPELSVDKNGEATKRLQQRLIELGFLSGSADGFFGQQTKAAVEALESYIRELEQDLIDARPVETSAPTAEPTVQPTAEPVNILPENTHELSLIPRNTPEPTAEPTAQPTPEPMDIALDAVKLEPVTQVDGVADALLQAYIYSDAYKVARRELSVDTEGSDVSRLQQRLLALGCSIYAPDGHYGGNTARSVRIFQYYNGLPQTGQADMQTLQLIFSDAAKRPTNPILAEGSSGDAVKTLQTRLRNLGFSTIGTDGDYGAGTVGGVKNLQQYLCNMEEAYLRAQDAAIPADADLSSKLSIEVNGVADPMVLDAFYSASFPAIPAEMSNGSRGDNVVRLQRRLSGLNFFDGTLDGQYGAATEAAVTAFQKRNSLPRTGVADQATLSVLFSSDALKALKPYVVKVSTADQRVYVYGLDDNNEYTVLVRKMKCSTGRNETPTPKGTFEATTGPGARWHYFKKFDCWAQYAYYIEGDIMFHSVLYNEQNGPVTQSSVNNLGRKASHGCVRLSVEDAKWLYQNCPAKTKIIVY